MKPQDDAYIGILAQTPCTRIYHSALRLPHSVLTYVRGKSIHTEYIHPCPPCPSSYFPCFLVAGLSSQAWPGSFTFFFFPFLFRLIDPPSALLASRSVCRWFRSKDQVQILRTPYILQVQHITSYICTVPLRCSPHVIARPACKTRDLNVQAGKSKYYIKFVCLGTFFSLPPLSSLSSTSPSWGGFFFLFHTYMESRPSTYIRSKQDADCSLSEVSLLNGIGQQAPCIFTESSDMVLSHLVNLQFFCRSTTNPKYSGNDFHGPSRNPCSARRHLP